VLEKRHAANRNKRLGNTGRERSNSAPVARRKNQTLSNGTPGVSFASAETTELSEGLGILGA
jgi:hypothetical protein